MVRVRGFTRPGRRDGACVASRPEQPGTYPIILAPLPGGFADAGDENQNPPTLAYAPAKASASPRDGSLFVQPSRIVVGSSFVNQKMKVVSGDASLVPVAFAAAEATARGFVPSGVRCVVGGASDVVGRLSDSDDAALDALSDALVASCDGRRPFRRRPSPPGIHRRPRRVGQGVPNGRNGSRGLGARRRGRRGR